MYGILKISSYTTVWCIFYIVKIGHVTWTGFWLCLSISKSVLCWIESVAWAPTHIWAYLSFNLEFSVMQLRLDVELLTKYLSVHFEHCWMEIVLFVGSGDKYFRLSRIEVKWVWRSFQVIVILVSVRSLVGKLKTSRKPKSDQDFEWLAELDTCRKKWLAATSPFLGL